MTPDSPSLVASSFVLFFLAKVLETGQGAWWLAVGAAVGCALLSKYTSLFFGPAILIWLAVVPKQRRWLLSPWPYLGAIVAFAIFAPVIIWNADHQWLSFLKQISGRIKVEDFRPGFIAELVPTQIAFATPLVFILGAMGLHALARRQAGAMPARVLINAMFWTITDLFRLAFAACARRGGLVRAGLSAACDRGRGGRPSGALGAARAAARRFLPALGLAARAPDVRGADRAGQYRPALGYRRDATVRSVGVGWREFAGQIEAVRQRTGATCILAPDYGTTSWLAFYLPRGTCVAQQMQRIRWINMREPDRRAARRAAALCRRDQAARADDPAATALPTIREVAELTRKRGPLVVETYTISLLSGPKGDVFDRTPPPELLR